MKKILFRLWMVAILPFAVSCNIYAPLQGSGSAEDKLEEALKCLHNNDLACAQTAYEGLPDGDQKKQKLCLINLARAGFTISVLLNTITIKSSSMLGEMAKAVAPWSSTKNTAAADAVTNCTAYSTTSSSGDLGVLVKAVAHVVRCATLMAKTDQFQGDSAGTCQTTTVNGNNNGTVETADISTDSNGALTNNGSGGFGMCNDDTSTCLSDIQTANGSNLGGSGLTGVSGGVSNIPEALRTGSLVAAAIRVQLKTTIQ